MPERFKVVCIPCKALYKCSALLYFTLQGSYVEAVTQMRGCLLALGRPLPTTKLDLIASLFWSVLRQLLHRAGCCRVVEWRAASLWRPLNDHDVKLSARDAAVVYHKLLQLHLTGICLSVCLSVCLSLCLSLWRPLNDHDVKLSARDAAVVYHKLLQLHLTGICLSVCLSVCLSLCLSVCLSVSLSVSVETIE